MIHASLISLLCTAAISPAVASASRPPDASTTRSISSFASTADITSVADTTSAADASTDRVYISIKRETTPGTWTREGLRVGCEIGEPLYCLGGPPVNFPPP